MHWLLNCRLPHRNKTKMIEPPVLLIKKYLIRCPFVASWWSMQASPSHFTLRSSLKCCLKLSRIPYPSEGGQNKIPGNLVRVLRWHGLSFWGQVCLLSGPVEGNCLWLPAQPSARQRQIVWTPVFSFPNCCTSTHQLHRHNISYQIKRLLLWQIWEYLVYKHSITRLQNQAMCWFQSGLI